jgi:SAM-dependent methyltransferase
MHGTEAPSAWVQRWSHLVPTGGTVLDVACGQGRHLRWFAGRGHAVTGVDRDPVAVAATGRFGRVVQADIENGPWPFEGQRFDGVVVTNYLWRALLPVIVDSVAEGGVLIYETFAIGNESVGNPRGRTSCCSRASC